MIRRMLLPLCLLGAFIAPAMLLAQDAAAPPVAEDSGGNPIYGYLAFGALGGLTLAIICRSSRRS